jgi:hypothetical protein
MACGGPGIRSKINLNWARKSRTSPLSRAEAKTLISRLQKLAPTGSVFSIDLYPNEIEHIKENVNCYLMEINLDPGEDKIWCLIGADERAVMMEYKRI